MNRLRVGLALTALTTSAFGALGCGTADAQLTCGAGTLLVGSECEPRVAEPTIAVTVSSLQADHEVGQPLYANHPVKLRVGLTGTRIGVGNGFGKAHHLALGVGLIPEVAQGDGYAGCYLGSANAELTGDGDEQVFTIDTLVQNNCRPNLNYRLYVTFDTTDGSTTPKANYVAFLTENRGKAENKACKGLTAGGVPTDCDLRYQVLPSPGLNYRVIELVPQSSVAVMYVPARAPSAELIPGKSETEQPLFRASVTTAIDGKDLAQTLTNAEKPAPDLKLVYSLRPLRNTNGDGWRRLNLDARYAPACTPGQRVNDINDLPDAYATRTCDSSGTYQPTYRKLESPAVGVEFTTTDGIYAADLRATIASGTWSNEEDFVLQACLETVELERADPVYGGETGRSDNCAEVPVRILRAAAPGAGSATTGALAHAFTSSWAHVAGSERSLEVATRLDAEARLSDPEGVVLRNKLVAGARSRVLPELAGNLVDASVMARASSKSLGIEADLTVLGTKLFTFRNNEANAPVAGWTAAWGVKKQIRVGISRSFLLSALDFDMMVLADVGFEPDLTVGRLATQACRDSLRYDNVEILATKPFEAVSLYCAYMNGGFTPRAALTSTFNLKLAPSTGAASATVALDAAVKLLDVNSPLKVLLGLAHLKSTMFIAYGDVRWSATLTPLDAKIRAAVSAPSLAAQALGVADGKTYSLLYVGGILSESPALLQRASGACLGKWGSSPCTM